MWKSGSVTPLTDREISGYAPSSVNLQAHPAIETLMYTNGALLASFEFHHFHYTGRSAIQSDSQ
jgi:hypothetical protein